MELTDKMNELIANMDNAKEKYDAAETRYMWALGETVQELLLRENAIGGRAYITLPLYDFDSALKPIQWGGFRTPTYHALAIKYGKPQYYEDCQLKLIVQDNEYHTNEILFQEISLNLQHRIIKRMIEIIQKK